MSPERWRQVRELFDATLEQPPDRRSSYAAAAAADDDELRREVEEMLAAYDESGDLLTVPAAARLQPPAPFPRIQDWEGRRLGPYRLTRKLASGGMGAVYVGERADKEFEKEVAIKVVRPGLDNEAILQRFLQERQVLAGLDHPNIARLIDGGTTPEGMPYLVMEYVENGEPVDAYCDGRRLDIAKRLALFRTVCGALQSAHQNLVVHRDLKPQNILVTPDGTAKLLDFGIAKLIGSRPEDTALTIESAPMTPEYASPEQVRNEPVTTATDVYAMGVVLYRLLTGRAPYRGNTRNMIELFEAVVNQEIERPSEAVMRAGGLSPAEVAAVREGSTDKLVRRLRGDLDVIALTALQKDPRRRYASIEHLSDDIRRHLEGLPVAARGDTLGYRLGKFVGRHKVAAGMTGLFTAGLIATTITSVHFARQARQEQRSAERRFGEVRQLARFVLFEFDDAIRSGETSARQVLVNQALGYLDRLSKEAGGDASLLRETAEAYLKIGDIQGNLYTANLGDAAAARESYLRASRTADELLGATPGSREAAILAGTAKVRLGDLAVQASDRGAASKLYAEALALFEPAAAADPAGPAAELAAETVSKTGFAQLHLEGNAVRALETQERALAMARDLARRRGSASSAEEVVASSLGRVGQALMRLDRAKEGAERLREACDVYEKLILDTAGSSKRRRSLQALYTVLGDALTNSGGSKEAGRVYERAADLAAELLRSDPKNRQYLRDRHIALGRAASAARLRGDRARAESATSEALRILAGMADQPNVAVYDLQQYVRLLVTRDNPTSSDFAAAIRYGRRAVEMTKGGTPSILDGLARAYAGAGDRVRAIQTEETALALLPAVKPGEPKPQVRMELEANLARFRALAEYPR